MFERRLLRSLDWLLAGSALLVAGLGLPVIYSASGEIRLLIRQAIWLALSLAGMALMLYLDYRKLAHFSRWIYLAVLGLLALVLVIGTSAGGAVRWIWLGRFQLQPSEFAKLGVIISLAAMLSRRERLGAGRMGLSLLQVLVPVGLVAIQPDLGTALVLLAIWLGIVFLAGARWSYLAPVLGAAILLTVASWHLPLLKGYQKARLAAFVDPKADPLGAGWHVLQSQIAVGSGRLLGRGLGEGSQSQLRFIPARQTDFIFTVVGEEFGFLGAAALVLLYLAMIWRVTAAAEQADDRLGSLLAGGVAAMLAFQVLVNAGMTVRLMPVTGVPLPLFSYGGSSLLVTMMAIGLALGVGMRRQKIRF